MITLSAVEMLHDSALHKFTIDIDNDIDIMSIVFVSCLVLTKLV